MQHRFDVVTMHPGTLLDEEQLEAITGDLLGALRELGGRPRAASTSAAPAQPLFLLVATGGSERAILDWWAEHGGEVPDGGLRLIAHPGNNSLPAALEVLARLQQDGAPGRIFYLRGADDASGLREIADVVRGDEVRRNLRRARIGVVGAPSDWLVASMPETAIVAMTWGPTLVSLGMDEVVAGLQSAPDADVEALAEDLAGGADEIREPTRADRLDVARVHVALERLVADHRLDALTVRCFDLVLGQKTTGCFALAQLLDDGVIAGCEGDVVSTVGMLWARELLGSTPWMANPAQVDPERNTLWLAHCTVPRSLVASYGLRSHFESGLGVGIQGVLPAGPVTLLRIGGSSMERVWLAEGEILRSGEAENLCRTQAEIRLTAGGRVADLLRAPLGNHLVLVSGRHLERLRGWCADSSIHVVV
jgi:L-fucose isomerase-like protein